MLPIRRPPGRDAAMKPRPIDPTHARTRKLGMLARKVAQDQLATPLGAGASMSEFLEALPDTLAAKDLRDLANAIASARRNRRTVLLMMGAHPLKVGLGRLICALILDGTLSAIATNGAAIIHDFELAFAGRTSEDVAAELADGSFGMVEETGAFLNGAVKKAEEEGAGLGEVVGREIMRARLKYRDASIFAAAHAAGIPATVHVTLGADIIHMHPRADGAAIGAASFADFHRLTAVVAGLSRGAVLNLGSAVVMPEVFLKALNLARNLGNKVERFTAADMDFVRHYRPRMNVVERPTMGGGRGIMLTGHHELMFPLLVAAIREAIARPLRARKKTR
jgi:deoxyhypusine synthase